MVADAYAACRTGFVLSGSLLTALLAIPNIGCDSFHVTQQVAAIRVSEVESGYPAAGAKIQFASRHYLGRTSHLTESERNDLWLSRSMNEPAVTDEDGMALLPINIGTVVGGLVHEPFNPQADRLTGQPYVFRVCRGAASETLSVLMVPGHESRGRLFQIAILSIGPAREITTEYTASDRVRSAPAVKPNQR